MRTSTTSYVIVTPVRDEVANLARTIESVAGQTVRPVEWIIVNDGSTDETGAIIDEAARKFPWLRAVHRSNRGFRKPGGGVVEAFNEGYTAIQTRDWEFIVKLDGDLSFEADYFQKCFDHFECEPTLGVGGGAVCNPVKGQLRVEKAPSFHVRGATKIYRRDCWNSLGGLWPAPGWDTIDEVKAQRLGWRTRTFSDLHVIQHRPTGQADGFWSALVKYGRANYIAGYHPLFMLCKCARRLVQKPYIVGSFGLLYGFVSGYTKQVPQLDDRPTIAYLRQQQLNRLFGGPSIWR
jgi:glycosyltransferase involved in cell wall biosynthesis